MYVNIFYRYLGAVNEVVVENPDGGHTVFINDRLSQQGQQNAFAHALSHIVNDDFSEHGYAGDIEYKRHKNPEECSPRDAAENQIEEQG